jgi:hypothetical protein
VTEPTSDQLALANRLLAHEREAGATVRTAAARTVAKIFFELLPLIGSTGVLALFARSVLNAKGRCKALGGLVITVDSIDAACGHLERHLDATPDAEVVELGTTLTASLLSLISTFIGERLTLQLLHNAWPALILTKESK